MLNTRKLLIRRGVRRSSMLGIWYYLTFGRRGFPTSTYNKLKGKKYESFQITKKINNTAYVVALLLDLNISSIFNVADLYNYHPPNEPDSGNSRSSSFQVGETDVEQTAHAFLEQQGRSKSQHKIKGGCQ